MCCLPVPPGLLQASPSYSRYCNIEYFCVEMFQNTQTCHNPYAPMLGVPKSNRNLRDYEPLKQWAPIKMINRSNEILGPDMSISSPVLKHSGGQQDEIWSMEKLSGDLTVSHEAG